MANNATHETDRAEAIAAITAAFRSVRRDGGISLHQAKVIDEMGTDEEEMLARARDTDRSWQEVPDADIEHGDFVLIFLDRIGFLYYLPAFLIWVLKNHGVANGGGGLAMQTTISALQFPGPIDPELFEKRSETYTDFHPWGIETTTIREGDGRLERFRAMSMEQARAVHCFLTYMATYTALSDDAQQALDGYWAQFS